MNWRRQLLRWSPAALLTACAALASAVFAPDRAGGCDYPINANIDVVTRIGWSWIPPRVTCRLTFGGRTWTDVQPKWGLLLPMSLLLAAALCVWLAVRRDVVAMVDQRRSRWHALSRALVYLVLAVLTQLGLAAMLFGAEGALGAVPLVTVPVLGVWTARWFWRNCTP